MSDDNLITITNATQKTKTYTYPRKITRVEDVYKRRWWMPWKRIKCGELIIETFVTEIPEDFSNTDDVLIFEYVTMFEDYQDHPLTDEE